MVCVKAAYQQLILILGEQLSAFSELRVLLDREQEVIAKMDADALEVIAGTKLHLQDRVAELEGQRLQVVRGLAERLGLDADGLSLKELAAHAPEPQKSTIIKVRRVFGRLADEITVKVDENTKRINRSLWLIKNIRDIITNQIQAPPTYEGIVRGPSGGTPSATGGGRI